jgi:selenide,water dikinase
VESAGCASKINQQDLKKALAGLPEPDDPRVLVGSGTCDDAGIFQLDEHTALVQSVDVFTPSVDDPYTFGQIAAANSVSDIYAMGGTPLTALSVIAFPIDILPHRVMNDLLRGGIDKMKEAGVSILGGHSIKDKEVKFGFAVTGTVDPDKMVTNNRAKPGDSLVLTKPLGTGVISFAGQMDKAATAEIHAVSRSMTTLNKGAAEAMMGLGLKTATDVTGFGFLGHLSEIVTQSRVTAEIWTDKVPLFEGVIELIRQHVASGAVERNREYASRFVDKDEDVGEDMEIALYDPQTSGGLLICCPQEKLEKLLNTLQDKGISHPAEVGRIKGRSDGRIVLKRSQKDPR